MSNSTTNTATSAAGDPLPPLPKDHLDHPEQWATGADPATQKQKGFIAVLEDKNPGLVPSEGIDKEGLDKSEASEIIEKLKNGEKVVSNEEQEGVTAEKSEKNEIEIERSSKEDDESRSDEIPGKKRKATATAEGNQVEGDVDELDPSPAEADGKDAKESKQTTLDGAFSTDADSGKPKEEEERAPKKPRLDTAEIDQGGSDTTDPSEAAPSNAKENTSVTNGETIPGSDAHLDHPENWATGDEPATEKQKGFIKVLEKQKGSGAVSGDVKHLGKSEASERIEELKEQ
ncbi:hypothetical protein I316_03064 [Kwoniella heveanensis BCC8398]|uniref:Uncharacterized protein n=1 Tax=Kwoniella heveanensis BCC8398 TaxID=1296120 RepID=A0A1B9GVG4_9TREE|nr:hypothetical protein I316_03064 [Kwoniella heveanensis BCC8398]